MVERYGMLYKGSKQAIADTLITVGKWSDNNENKYAVYGR